MIREAGAATEASATGAGVAEVVMRSPSVETGLADERPRGLLRLMEALVDRGGELGTDPGVSAICSGSPRRTRASDPNRFSSAFFRAGPTPGRRRAAT